MLHETPWSSLCDVFVANGAIDHARPFQCWTRAESPTATQFAGLGHATPLSSSKVVPGASGVIDHLVPSQCSATGADSTSMTPPEPDIAP